MSLVYFVTHVPGSYLVEGDERPVGSKSLSLEAGKLGRFFSIRKSYFLQVKSLILVGTLEKCTFLILLIPKPFLIYGVGYDREAFVELTAPLRKALRLEFRESLHFSFLFAQTFNLRTHVNLWISKRTDLPEWKRV